MSQDSRHLFAPEVVKRLETAASLPCYYQQKDGKACKDRYGHTSCQSCWAKHQLEIMDQSGLEHVWIVDFEFMAVVEAYVKFRADTHHPSSGRDPEHRLYVSVFWSETISYGGWVALIKNKFEVYHDKATAEDVLNAFVNRRMQRAIEEWEWAKKELTDARDKKDWYTTRKAMGKMTIPANSPDWLLDKLKADEEKHEQATCNSL